jgi:hypothetical protein
MKTGRGLHPKAEPSVFSFEGMENFEFGLDDRFGVSKFFRAAQ